MTRLQAVMEDAWWDVIFACGAPCKIVMSFDHLIRVIPQWVDFDFSDYEWVWSVESNDIDESSGDNGFQAWFENKMMGVQSQSAQVNWIADGF